MSARKLPDAGEVSRRLKPHILAICQEILPNGHREKNEWRAGSIAGEAGRSLGVHLTGPDAGRWIDGANTTDKGDALDLVAAVLFGGDLAQAWRWAIAWLGLDDRQDNPPKAEPAPVPVQDDTTEQRRFGLAQKIWRETLDPEGSPAEAYVRFRGCALPESGVLRFHPACPCGSNRLPAMVAEMTHPVTGKFTGIHRTFIRADGQGKADVAKPKMMLGRAGVIRITGDYALGYCIGVCEGIETALAIQQHLQFDAIWAAGTAGGIERFPLLHSIVSSIWIFPDADDAGASAQAARVCAERWREDGREVRIITPPAGADWHARAAA